MSERGSLPRPLLTGAARGRGNNGGEAIWSPADRTKQKDFSKCPEPNSNKNNDLESGRVWRSEVLTTKA